MRCLTSAKMNMRAEVLRQTETLPAPDPGTEGEWVSRQDPITFEIIRVWVPGGSDTDDPETVEDERVLSIPCMARGVAASSVGGQGSGEQWGETYAGFEFVRMSFPSQYVITKGNRVTNIRSSNGNVLWKEAYEGGTEEARATIFEVVGVIPVVDPFGKNVENVALLERAEVQSG